jgi:cysteinyl-tRNA synthetase
VGQSVRLTLDALGAISDEEIADILERRDEARTVKDFATADQLRETLRSRGVEVDDKTQSWTAVDGREGSSTSAGGG